MSQSQFSLSWGSHTKHLSNGLSVFQQNGDFVDMTLAADGHFVKVHQVIIALSSPYIKELLASAPCPHPVIFLSNISYTTLCSILEYIYTGEVYLSHENLFDLKTAAKELHIKGLEDMNIPQSATTNVDRNERQDNQNMETNDSNMMVLDDNICYFEITNPRTDDKKATTTYAVPSVKKQEDDEEEEDAEEQQDDSVNEHLENTYSYQIEFDNNVTADDNNIEEIGRNLIKNESKVPANSSKITPLQYTVSNQGSLQIILNRYVYYLKHTNRNNSQQWRCVDYLTNRKCPAHVLTKDGVLAVRVSAHTHPFHDKRILKKLRTGAVYSAISEAQEQGQNIRNNRNADNNLESSE